MINEREAVPVDISGYVLYCEEFKASGNTVYSEQPSVTGASLITNTHKKAARITFSGRVYDETSPLAFVSYIGNVSGTVSGLTITYRGLTFRNCSVQSYTAEDRGEGFIRASVTVITAENILAGAESE